MNKLDEKVTLEELSDDTTSLSSHNSSSSNNNNELIIKDASDGGGGGDGDGGAGGTSKSNSFDHEFMFDSNPAYQKRDYYHLNAYPNVNDYLFENMDNKSSSKMRCLECGSYTYLIKCNSHCELMLCELCQQKHWQMEINELIKLKTDLENNVADLRNYLAARRSQSIENIKNSQQLKKFITMTMQQIKRKVELELENKRDELYSSIDQFVENQKKYTIFMI
jgi:hypothetical protein